MMMKLWKRIAIEAFAVLGLVGDVLLMYNFGGRNCVLSLVLGTGAAGAHDHTAP